MLDDEFYEFEKNRQLADTIFQWLVNITIS